MTVNRVLVDGAYAQEAEDKHAQPDHQQSEVLVLPRSHQACDGKSCPHSELSDCPGVGCW
jgi:hypothetical protein